MQTPGIFASFRVVFVWSCGWLPVHCTIIYVHAGWLDGRSDDDGKWGKSHSHLLLLIDWMTRTPLVINKILRVVQLSLGPKWWNQNRRNAIIIFLRAFGPGRSTRASLKLLSSQKGSQLFKQMLFTYVHRYFSVTEIGAFPKISSSPLTIFLYI